MYGFILSFGKKSLGCGVCCYKEGQVYPNDTGRSVQNTELFVVLTFANGYLHQAIFLRPSCVPEKVDVY